MFDATAATIRALAVHSVGNKLRSENLGLSEQLVKVDAALEKVLLKYFLLPLAGTPPHEFSHPSDLELNEAYAFSKAAFAKKESFLQQSICFAKHLYSRSEHPKIHSGELCCVLFDGITQGGQEVKAIGLFKSEEKDRFLKIVDAPRGFRIDVEDGINTKQPDKGCLILSVAEESGFRIYTIARNDEARFWYDQFLQLRPTEDSSYLTEQCIELCKRFSQSAEVSPEERILLRERSYDYLASSENFNAKDFEKKVLHSKPLAKSFESFKKQFQKTNNVTLPGEFQISPTAVKKAKRALKSQIRLDTGVTINVSLRDEEELADCLERGFDSKRGMSFYKVFFRSEK